MSHWMIALMGGLLIGLAATLLLWLDGRIAGISGIVSGLLRPARGEIAWRAAFLFGLIATAGLYMALIPGADLPRTDLPRPILLIAGLLVGFGTAMGGGCTSGHGVCGLGRLSRRSFVAVLTFMATAIVTTYLVQHVWRS
ncbi:MAG: YeeE/YedE family protein [Burkholderiales bacterium]|nr:YeeE/YedE family protein [Burkholderiales bacterium]